MNPQLIWYRIEVRDKEDGYWKDFAEIFPKTEVIEELVKRRILFWKWRVIKKIKNQLMTETATRVKALRIARKLSVDQDVKLYEVLDFGDGRIWSYYKIWENGKFTDY